MHGMSAVCPKEVINTVAILLGLNAADFNLPAEVVISPLIRLEFRRNSISIHKLISEEIDLCSFFPEDIKHKALNVIDITRFGL